MQGRQNLTQMAKDIEGIIRVYFRLDERPGVAIAVTLPPVFKDVHWVTNLTRENGIHLLESTIAKMKADPIPFGDNSPKGTQ